MSSYKSIVGSVNWTCHSSVFYSLPLICVQISYLHTNKRSLSQAKLHNLEPISKFYSKLLWYQCPYKYLYLFDEPRTAHVSFEGNDNASYNCDIISHNAKLIHREDGNYFMAIATVSTQRQKSPVLQKYMKVDVRIIVSNKKLWQQVFG